jgi:hypothetical protein
MDFRRALLTDDSVLRTRLKRGDVTRPVGLDAREAAESDHLGL